MVLFFLKLMYLVDSCGLFLLLLIVIVMALVVVVCVAATKGSVWQIWERSSEL